jgi:hypothetical protein
MKLHSRKYESRFNAVPVSRNTFNDCDEFQIHTPQLVLRAAVARNKVFDGLHSASASPLTAFLIHVIDISPWYFVPIQDLPELNKMLIDDCLVEALSTLWVKSRRFSQTDIGVSPEKTTVPPRGWLLSNDPFQLSKQSSFVERTCNVTSVSNPVTQNLFLNISEVLLRLMGCICRLGATMPTISKSTPRNIKMVSSL